MANPTSCEDNSSRHAWNLHDVQAYYVHLRQRRGEPAEDRSLPEAAKSLDPKWVEAGCKDKQARRQALRTWLDFRSKNHGLSEEVEEGLASTSQVHRSGQFLVLSGLLGFVLAMGVLTTALPLTGRPTDGQSVNIFFCWLALVGSQALILMVSVVLLLMPRNDKSGRGSLVRLISKGLKWFGVPLELFRTQGKAAFTWPMIGALQMVGVTYAATLAFAVWARGEGKTYQFYWESTAVQNQGILESHGLTFTRAVDWPWRDWRPQATIRAEDLEASKATGEKEEAQNAAAAVASDRWWRFLLASLVAYGLIPRLLLFGYVHWRCWRLPKTWAFDDSDSEDLARNLLSNAPSRKITDPADPGIPPCEPPLDDIPCAPGPPITLHANDAIVLGESDLLRQFSSVVTGNLQSDGLRIHCFTYCHSETEKRSALAQLQSITWAGGKPILILVVRRSDTPLEWRRRFLKSVLGLPSMKGADLRCVLIVNEDTTESERIEAVQMWSDFLGQLGIDPNRRPILLDVRKSMKP